MKTKDYFAKIHDKTLILTNKSHEAFDIIDEASKVSGDKTTKLMANIRQNKIFNLIVPREEFDSLVRSNILQSIEEIDEIIKEITVLSHDLKEKVKKGGQNV